MYNQLIQFNEMILYYDKYAAYINRKRALLYILSKCITLIDESSIDEGDEIKLDSTNPNNYVFLVVNKKNKYNDPFNESDIFYSYDYSLYYKFEDAIKCGFDYATNIDHKIKILDCTYIDKDGSIDIDFKVIPNIYDNFTSDQFTLVNSILADYISNSPDDETYDLFHYLVVPYNEDKENDS